MASSDETADQRGLTELEYALESDFHGLPIRLSAVANPNASHLLIAAHGSYGSMECFSDIPSLAHGGDISVVRLSTARREELYRAGSFFEAFAGKNFGQECEDVRRAIAHVMAHKNMLVRDAERADIALLGLSLGGTIATLLAHRFHEIQKLFLVSAGCRTKNRDLPLLNAYGEAETAQIKRAASAFTGSTLHVGPAEDPVVPRAYQDELFDAFPKCSKRRLVLPDADHVLTFHRKELHAAICQELLL